MKNLFKYKNKTVEILCDDGNVFRGVISVGCDINYTPILIIEGLQKTLYPENVTKIKIIKNCG
ncbi:MAG: hypothetical protein IKA54_00005 [Clostridia bacterium]|jgi:hypothetical protein|nr:hypothetical protein [Clostridia bacterium]